MKILSTTDSWIKTSKAFSGARIMDTPQYVYTRLSIPVKIDEVLKKAPQNRVNIFDNVDEVSFIVARLNRRFIA